jgi:transcriptional regulator with XRE-family HTH domain
MLRGAFRLPVREFADFAGISKSTVVSIEAGGGTWARTLDKIAAAFAPYVEFLDAIEGVSGPGIRLKLGFEAAVHRATQGANASQGDDKGGLDALGWDWDASEPDEDDGPLPPLDWTDEEKAEQIEHWRSCPERWARLAEVSQLCLLRAMDVERL